MLRLILKFTIGLPIIFLLFCVHLLIYLFFIFLDFIAWIVYNNGDFETTNKNFKKKLESIFQ